MSQQPIPSVADIASVLDKAANHIDLFGWTQNALYDEAQAMGTPLKRCRVCAMGAINSAVYGGPQYPVRERDLNPAGEMAVEHLRMYLGINVSVAQWNDQKLRTQDEVTAAMRSAAAELRGLAEAAVS